MDNTRLATGKYKHIIITGASSGIGEALAYAYACPGLVLGLTGRNQERLSRVAEQCRAQGADVHEVCIDVTDQEAMERWLKMRDQAFPVDLIIANAGISAGTGDQGLEAPAQIRQQFDVNVTGVFNTIEPLLPFMVERGSGHVAMVSSLAGFRGWPGAPAYCATKAAVKTYGEGLRGALAGSGVSVSVICPGFVKSPMTDQNPYSMPFIIPVEKAAKIIQKGLEKSKGRICFPLPAHFFAWLFSVIPDTLAHKILKKTPSKQAL